MARYADFTSLPDRKVVSVNADLVSAVRSADAGGGAYIFTNGLKDVLAVAESREEVVEGLRAAE